MARHAHNPAARHWKAVRKIIAYLKATKDLGVVFQRGGDLKLSLFADVDHADILCNDRLSISGVALMLGNTAVSTSSTTQHCVTLSTSEVELLLLLLLSFTFSLLVAIPKKLLDTVANPARSWSAQQKKK